MVHDIPLSCVECLQKLCSECPTSLFPEREYLQLRWLFWCAEYVNSSHQLMAASIRLQSKHPDQTHVNELNQANLKKLPAIISVKSAMHCICNEWHHCAKLSELLCKVSSRQQFDTDVCFCFSQSTIGCTDSRVRSCIVLCFLRPKVENF